MVKYALLRVYKPSIFTYANNKGIIIAVNMMTYPCYAQLLKI